MEKSTKFVNPLTEEQRQLLKEITEFHALPEQRMRAHAILLSDQRYSIDQIAGIYQVDWRLVDGWLDCWNERQFDGMGDAPNVFTTRPSPEMRKIWREQSLNRLRSQNQARRMAEGQPKIITLNDKPGKYTAQDIIEYLDNIPHVMPYSFVDLGHPYFYTANSRLTLFADETRWAIVFEKSGYANRGRRIELWLNYFGNCLENLRPSEGADKFYNSQYFVLIDNEELLRIEARENMAMQIQGAASVYEVKLGERKLLDFAEKIWEGIEEIKVRGRYVKIPNTKQGYQKWIPDIRTRDYPEGAAFRDLPRYLAYEYEELCRATDEEVRYCIPDDLPKIMVIDEWHHETYSVYNGSIHGDPPSSYETYRLIAEVLETRNPSRFKPTLNPNNHWINWPDGGAL